jgi:hypothetical protein
MTDLRQNNKDACRTMEVKSHAFLSLALGGNKWCASRSSMTGIRWVSPFHRTPSCFTWTDRRTERHDEANSRFSKFSTRTLKKKKKLIAWTKFTSKLARTEVQIKKKNWKNTGLRLLRNYQLRKKKKDAILHAAVTSRWHYTQLPRRWSWSKSLVTEQHGFHQTPVITT